MKRRVFDFMRNVIGGEIILRYDRADGTLMHASVRMGNSTIMIADGTDDHPSFPVWMHVYVDDVDGTYHRAIEHGATAFDEPKDQCEGRSPRRRERHRWQCLVGRLGAGLR
jgi:PhnB protein